MKPKMSLKQLKAAFEKYEDEYLEFEDVANKRSRRPDMHAFIVLDELFQSDDELISSAEHDQFFLEIDPIALARVATEELILDLVRCGILYDEETESLFMFA